MYEQQLRNIVRESHLPVETYGADHFVLTDGMIGELRTVPYLERWKLAVDRGWYHIKLEDHSLFLFRDGGVASYSYLQCPLSVPSYREFLAQLSLECSQLNRRERQSDYDMVMDTASLREHITPIRYDYDTVGYEEGVHPVGHLHIGLDNQIRLAVSRTMSAVSFVLFVMRQAYPQCWRRLLERATPGIAKRIRPAGGSLPAVFWTQVDQLELYFQ